MTIKVTQHHIDFGNRQSGYYCPVARALNDTLGCQAVVGGHFATIWTAHSYRVVHLSEKAQKFIYLFDAYGPLQVRPFEFELPC